MISKPMQAALDAVSTMPRHAPTPWRLSNDGRTIEARPQEGGAWQPIVTLRATKHLDPKANGAFILCAVSDYQKATDMIEAMLSALETCLECERLGFSAEHEAQLCVDRAKRFLGQEG